MWKVFSADIIMLHETVERVPRVTVIIRVWRDQDQASLANCLLIWLSAHSEHLVGITFLNNPLTVPDSHLIIVGSVQRNTLEHRTMDKVRKHSNSVSISPVTITMFLHLTLRMSHFTD
jgi:hypothetical protein